MFYPELPRTKVRMAYIRYITDKKHWVQRGQLTCSRSSSNRVAETKLSFLSLLPVVFPLFKLLHSSVSPIPKGNNQAL